eukprot:1395275-Amorphochlora_amoeboformis.AAC.1
MVCVRIGRTTCYEFTTNTCTYKQILSTVAPFPQKAEVCKAEAKAKAILITAEAEKKARMEKGEG